MEGVGFYNTCEYRMLVETRTQTWDYIYKRAWVLIVATITAPTMLNTLRRPRTHTENPHSLFTTRIATVDTSCCTRTVATIELWQSTINNALAKVFGDTV